uniref:Uncharacterized protein n=1 Tax=Quercus lobata TaxID=97700 RepID=A0A7N2N2C2_QUELO
MLNKKKQSMMFILYADHRLLFISNMRQILKTKGRIVLFDEGTEGYREDNALLASCKYVSNLKNKRIDLFDHGTEGYGEDNVLLASCSGYMHAAMTNQQLMDSGNRMMDETDQAIGGQKRLYKTPSMLEQKLQQHSRIRLQLIGVLWHYSSLLLPLESWPSLL